MRIIACCLLAIGFIGCTCSDDEASPTPDAGAVTVTSPGSCAAGLVPVQSGKGWTCMAPGIAALQGLQGQVNTMQTALQAQQAQIQAVQQPPGK